MRSSPDASNRKTDIMIAVIFSGISGSGKTEFYTRYFSDAYTHVELDSLSSRLNEKKLIHQCIRHGESYVIDNENATEADRARYIGAAKEAGYRVIGYYFPSDPDTALQRRGMARDRRAVRQCMRTAARMTPPAYSEGFDEIYEVTLCRDGEYAVVALEKK